MQYLSIDMIITLKDSHPQQIFIRGLLRTSVVLGERAQSYYRVSHEDESQRTGSLCQSPTWPEPWSCPRARGSLQRPRPSLFVGTVCPQWQAIRSVGGLWGGQGNEGAWFLVSARLLLLSGRNSSSHRQHCSVDVPGGTPDPGGHYFTQSSKHPCR